MTSNVTDSEYAYNMKGNAPDCYDDTTGAGTSGTANFWINDFGVTENKPGLCKHATP